MIKGISSNSRYIQITGGSTNAPYMSPGAVGAGMMRWNVNTNSIEINDGNIWHQLSQSYTNIDLSGDTKEILAWAAKKMQEEKELEALCSKYPGLAKARNNYEMFKKFIDTQEQSDNSTDGMQVVGSP